MKGFQYRTMLAALAFNENREAELQGKRTVKEVYQCYSKTTGEKKWKYKKGPTEERWKAELVNIAITKKQDFVPGEPTEALSDDDLNDGVDLLPDWLEQALQIESEEEDIWETD